MENTPRSKASQEIPLETADENTTQQKKKDEEEKKRQEEADNAPLTPIIKTLRGLPADLLSRDRDIQSFMGIAPETFAIWVKAAVDLNLAIGVQVGTKEGWSLTGDIHELFRKRPKLAQRQSTVRKKRLAERKQKK